MGRNLLLQEKHPSGEIPSQCDAQGGEAFFINTLLAPPAPHLCLAMPQDIWDLSSLDQGSNLFLLHASVEIKPLTTRGFPLISLSVFLFFFCCLFVFLIVSRYSAAFLRLFRGNCFMCRCVFAVLIGVGNFKLFLFYDAFFELPLNNYLLALIIRQVQGLSQVIQNFEKIYSCL